MVELNYCKVSFAAKSMWIKAAVSVLQKQNTK